MSRIEAVDCADVMVAWADGQAIEVRNRAGGPWRPSFEPKWDWDLFEYRIKPAAVLRPWTEEEVPLGARLRVKGRTAAVLLTDTCEEAERERWVQHYEHSLDGGKTWLPCGVEEGKQ